MPYSVEKDNIDEIYQNVIKELIINGKKMTRRGQQMTELRSVSVVLKNPRSRIVQNSKRKLSPYFLIGEFLWILSRSNDVEQLYFYNKAVKNFSDNGRTLYGAYGSRIGNQLDDVIKKLRGDIRTRQAVIVISRPTDITINTKDFPCNVFLQFWVDENDRLCLTTFVRSQDMYLGFPYDVFHWTLFQENIALILNLELGEYHHIMSNCHYYEKDFDNLIKIVNTNVSHYQPMKKLEYDFITNRFIVSESESLCRKCGVFKESGNALLDDMLKIVCLRHLDKKNVCEKNVNDINDEALRNILWNHVF